MTQPTGDLLEVIGRTRNLFLDFDGPICSIFARHPAPTVAAELRELLQRRDIPVDGLETVDDPLHLLRLVDARGDERTTRDVAEALRDAEVTAADSAEPTPRVNEVIQAALDTGRRLAVVSNNSAEAVTAYLQRHGLRSSFGRIVGRYAGMSPSLLKPSNHLLGLALIGMDAPPWSTTLVGDSASDVVAARSVPIGSIGYAGKPHDTDAATLAGADVVITSLAELADAIRAQPVVS